MNKKTLKFLKWIEEQMDNYNGENGTTEKLCCFCNVNKYNSALGILHKKDCPIIELRENIMKVERIKMKGKNKNGI